MAWPAYCLLCIHVRWLFSVSLHQDTGASHCIGENQCEHSRSACFGHINMGQSVVPESGLLVPEGLVASEGGCEVPQGDNIESGSAHAVKRILNIPWFYDIQYLSHCPQKVKKSWFKSTMVIKCSSWRRLGIILNVAKLVLPTLSVAARTSPVLTHSKYPSWIVSRSQAL